MEKTREGLDAAYYPTAQGSKGVFVDELQQAGVSVSYHQTGMTFTFFISTAVVCALITAIGGIITTRMAQASAERIARDTASKEIEKMERTWEREDIVSSDEEFAKMAAVVSRYVSYSTGAWEDEAIEAIAVIRSIETGTLGDLMDKLHACVQSEMYEKAGKLLDDIIRERRRIKEERKA